MTKIYLIQNISNETITFRDIEMEYELKPNDTIEMEDPLEEVLTDKRLKVLGVKPE